MGLIGQSILDFEILDLTKQPQPLHSRLYCLEPIAIGSSEVESLASYITRLAEAHCVSVGNLMSKEIKPILGIYTGMSSAIGEPTSFISAMNGTGVTTFNFVQTMEILTLRKDLSYLTMRIWRDVIAWPSLLRRYRVWCVDCLNEWKEKATVYEPLIWSIDVVRICLSHSKYLQPVCFNCGCQSSFIQSRSRVGFCPKCEQWLGNYREPNIALKNTLVKEQLEWDEWVAFNIGELLKVQRELKTPPCRKILLDNIKFCIGKITNESVIKFAELIKSSLSSINHWKAGKKIPLLPTLLRICFYAGSSLVQFLTDEIKIQPNRFIGQPQIYKYNKLKSKTSVRVDSEKIKEILQDAISEFPPPSLSLVSRRVGHEKKTLSRHFPLLCSKIVSKYTNYNKTQVLERRKASLEEFRQIAYSLYQKGIYPSQDNIRPYMAFPGYMQLKEFRLELINIQAELRLIANC